MFGTKRKMFSLTVVVLLLGILDKYFFACVFLHFDQNVIKLLKRRPCVCVKDDNNVDDDGVVQQSFLFY